MTSASLLIALSLIACKGEAPVAEIIDPIDGAEFQLGQPITFTATLSDDRSPVGFLNPSWSSDIGGELKGTKSFEGDQATITVPELAEGSHTVTLTLADPDDNVSETSVGITVLPNALPTAAFVAPTEAQEFSLQDTNHADIEVQFADLNEDNLFNLSLSWYGDIDTASDLPENPTAAGTANLVIGSLESGDYTIGVEVTDSYGGVGSAEVTFSVINADQDGDGFFSDEDCNDNDRLINPDAREWCDGVDNNCDGVVDEPTAMDAKDWYADLDGDGWGDESDVTTACDAPPESADRDGDCDDSEPAAHPYADEVCDGIDNNCDGESDESNVCNISLGLDSKARFLGETSGDQAGLSVAHAGDVNGDGVSDFVIGAPDVEGETTRYGAAYLVLGPVSGDIELEYADLTFSGDNTAHRVGERVAGGKDLDGDGYDDFLYAGVGDDDGTGEVTLVTGASAPNGIRAEAVYYGEANYSYAGVSIAMMTQVSGLAGEAVVIGAPYTENASSAQAGAVYLTTDLSGDVDLGDATTTIRGNASDVAGWATVSQDLDGNGSNGIALSAIGDQDEAGIIYLFDSLSAGEHALADADAQLIGARSGDLAGFALDSGADFNGDGYEDLLVGAPAESTAGTAAGSAYLMLGPVSGSTSLASADAIFRGLDDAEWTGWSVTFGDVNGDNLADAFIGAPEADGAFSKSGVIYTVWGSELVSGTSSLGDLEPQLRGQLTDEYAGESMDAADIDGDGRDDLLIGASGNRTNGAQSGATYLLMGEAFSF